MDIIKAYAVKNECYQTARTMKPKGIVVHSTGCNNPNLRRYIDYPEKLGENIYKNHWNVFHPGGKDIGPHVYTNKNGGGRCDVCGGRQVSVHAFIGYDKNKNVIIAEMLPLDICCWGVGAGKNGSYNFAPPFIQFEICEDNLANEEYYQKAFSAAENYCAYLCRNYNIPVSQIVSHKEAHKNGYGSNHGDPEYWMKKHADSMDDFRKRVQLLLDTNQSDHASDRENGRKDMIKAGDLVSIKSGATYYNGKKIPSWVLSQNWYVKDEPKNDRVVIDWNENKTNSICSPVRSTDLMVVSRNSGTMSDFGELVSPYKVRIMACCLWIFSEPKQASSKLCCLKCDDIQTITREYRGKDNCLWGKLNTIDGWICLDSVCSFR